MQPRNAITSDEVKYFKDNNEKFRVLYFSIFNYYKETPPELIHPRMLEQISNVCDIFTCISFYLNRLNFSLLSLKYFTSPEVIALRGCIAWNIHVLINYLDDFV
jgi:hypothetical protein